MGLVDIVLRGEAALLENRKSGEIITLMVTLLTLLITFMNDENHDCLSHFDLSRFYTIELTIVQGRPLGSVPEKMFSANNVFFFFR